MLLFKSGGGPHKIPIEEVMTLTMTSSFVVASVRYAYTQVVHGVRCAYTQVLVMHIRKVPSAADHHREVANQANW